MLIEILALQTGACFCSLLKDESNGPKECLISGGELSDYLSQGLRKTEVKFITRRLMPKDSRRWEYSPRTQDLSGESPR